MMLLSLAALALLAFAAITDAAAGTIVTVSTTTTASSAPTNSCLDNSSTLGRASADLRVAALKPVFTATPYSQYPSGSFYAFYKKYAFAGGNITTDLGWLSTSVQSGYMYNSGWGDTIPLYLFLTSRPARNCGLELGRNLKVLTDINVTEGGLFGQGGNRLFDVVVIGHEEYVTRSEYDQLRSFVASGGRLVAVGSNAFYAKVAYDSTSDIETFVSGHGGFFFNGVVAWRDDKEPVPWNPGGWYGSSYCCFRTFRYSGAVPNPADPIGNLLARRFGTPVFREYASHEEDAVTNLTGTSIVATFVNQSGRLIAAYVHDYGRGAVFSLSVFGTDIIGSSPSAQFFLVAAVSGALQPKGGGYDPVPPLALGATFTILLVGVPAVLIRSKRSDKAMQNRPRHRGYLFTGSIA